MVHHNFSAGIHELIQFYIIKNYGKDDQLVIDRSNKEYLSKWALSYDELVEETMCYSYCYSGGINEKPEED